MIQRKTTYRLVLGLLGVILIGSVAPSVSALEGTTEPQEPTTQPVRSTENRTAELQQRQAALQKKQQEQAKKELLLKQKRIEQCVAKSEGVNTALQKITENRQRIFNRLSELSDKVQAFVTNKKLVVANYDQLIANLSTRKTTAEASINQVQAVNTLNCNDVRTPKDQLQTFRDKRKGSVDALKEYRTAVKKLILAVKSAIASHKGLEGHHKDDQQKPEVTGEAQ